MSKSAISFNLDDVSDEDLARFGITKDCRLDHYHIKYDGREFGVLQELKFPGSEDDEDAVFVNIMGELDCYVPGDDFSAEGFLASDRAFARFRMELAAAQAMAAETKGSIECVVAGDDLGEASVIFRKEITRGLDDLKELIGVSRKFIEKVHSPEFKKNIETFAKEIHARAQTAHAVVT
jgi:hypothetical protein